MVGFLRVLTHLHRATHMEGDIGKVLAEMRETNRVAPAKRRFFYDDSAPNGLGSCWGRADASVAARRIHPR